MALGDDPFEVLGVPPTAFEPVVRKAYTKLLKRHRKEPAQVERLQDAFRRALWEIEVREVERRTTMGRGAALAPVPMLTDGASAAAGEGAPADPDPVEVGAWIRALAARLELDGPDPAAAMLARLGRDGRPADDPAWAVAALRALAALAWRRPSVDADRARLGTLPADPAVAAMAAKVQTDLDAARAYHARYRPVLPPGVIELLADGPLADDGGRRALLVRLRELTLEEPDSLLVQWDTLHARCPELIDALGRRLLEDVPLDRRGWTSLPAEARADVIARLRGMARETGVVRSLVTGVGGIALTGALLFVGGAEAGTGLFAPLAGLWSWLEHRQYHHGGVREAFARTLIEAGVTRACAREWLDQNKRKAMRVARFSWLAGRDQALLMVGLTAAAGCER